MPETDDRGMLRAEGFHGALACVAQSYQWPTGMVPDDTMFEWIIGTYIEPENSNFPPQMAFIEVSGVNECAWYITWIDACESGDTATADAAASYITEVIPNFPTRIPNYPVEIDDPSVIAFRQSIAEHVTLGDPAPIQQLLQHSCVMWQEGRGATE